MEFLARVHKKRAIILPIGLDVKEGDVVKCSCEVVPELNNHELELLSNFERKIYEKLKKLEEQ
jgi:hypothetical protein